jgi:hypothetical protein
MLDTITSSVWGNEEKLWNCQEGSKHRGYDLNPGVKTIQLQKSLLYNTYYCSNVLHITGF